MRALGKRSVSSFLALLINVAWYLAAISLGLMLVLSAVPLFTDLSHTEVGLPVSFSVDTASFHIIAPGAVAADIRDAHGSGTLRFPPPSGVMLTTTALLAAAGLAIGLWVLTQLRDVFRTLRDGHPFVAANATRIRWIGYAVIIGAIVDSLATYGANAYARSHFAADGLRFDAWPRLDMYAIICGLIILVIAEVFRAGARLDEDQSLTI
jgi:hypothetical protein